MRKITNECCDCSHDSYPCRGRACPLTHVEHFLCDKCEEETTLYEYEEQELCLHCLLEAIPIVEGSECYG